MSNELNALKGRIDAEFAGFRKEIESFQSAAKSEYDAREKRFQELFVPAAERVAGIARPRLELLLDHFKDKMDVKPAISQHLREVVLKLDSPLARIDLTFRLSHDAEVRNLVLDQTLEVLPILMRFDDHSGLTVPLDKIDDAKITQWLDDRIVKFVQTVGAIHQNQYYLKDHLVTDPVAGVQMPKYAAKSVLEADGTKYYFISDETRDQFAKQRGIA